MGAGASASGSDGGEIFAQLMAKWDKLSKEPQFAIDVQKPGRFELLDLSS